MKPHHHHMGLLFTTTAAVLFWSGCTETGELLPLPGDSNETSTTGNSHTTRNSSYAVINPDSTNVPAIADQSGTSTTGLSDENTLAQTVIIATYAPDGVGNNPLHPTWGSIGVQLLRGAAAAYADGISSLGGQTRPSARQISNVVVDQGDVDVINERLLSAMIYVWGQFLDHDIGLTPTGTTEVMQIPVPLGDPSFDPLWTGNQVIATMRSIFDARTGTRVANPRQQVNVVTAWLDGSMVYGSDKVRAQKLRTLSGGLLKTSPGDMPPLNNATYFPDGTLAMANDAHVLPDDQMFAAGDVRANENVELTALHALFIREHNYWANKFAANSPTVSTDEQLYQKARAMVIAEIQSITFNEWLPAVIGRDAVPVYRQYDAAINPGLTNEFSTAAFRFGHSLLGNDVEFLDDDGLPMHEEVPLSETFFNPALILETGIDPLLKYLASDPASELDEQIVASVRNFLFGPPGAGGLDLASLNIQRGRDHGLADYNSARKAYGLPRVTKFSEITSDTKLQAKLLSLFGTVNNIDLWIGALSEGHSKDASVGPTLRTIIGKQFAKLRDGDPLWYQRRFSGQLLKLIEKTKLSDVIRRNTRIRNIQSNVFFFTAGISGTVYIDTNGDGRPSRGELGVPHVTVRLMNTTENEIVATDVTDAKGVYRFDVLDGVRTGLYRVEVISSGVTDTVLAVSSTVAISAGAQIQERVNIPMPAP